MSKMLHAANSHVDSSTSMYCRNCSGTAVLTVQRDCVSITHVTLPVGNADHLLMLLQ